LQHIPQRRSGLYLNHTGQIPAAFHGEAWYHGSPGLPVRYLLHYGCTTDRIPSPRHLLVRSVYRQTRVAYITTCTQHCDAATLGADGVPLPAPPTCLLVPRIARWTLREDAVVRSALFVFLRYTATPAAPALLYLWDRVARALTGGYQLPAHTCHLHPRPSRLNGEHGVYTVIATAFRRSW